MPYIKHISINMPVFDPKLDKTSSQKAPDSEWQEFSISRFKLLQRVLACLLTVVLCLSLFMSSLNRYIQKHQAIEINHMSLIYLLLLFFIILMAFVAIISVRKVRISSERIEISTLFWQENLIWADLLLVHAPATLKLVWIRTKRCFYLLVKSEFKNYAELERHLSQKVDVKTTD